ncbi:MAG TPA: penicillin acylase family protein [Pseudogracilibacillus sp.]|nr:penicillin acylase family protein [Pseudogracilibacillus sp.]
MKSEVDMQQTTAKPKMQRWKKASLTIVGLIIILLIGGFLFANHYLGKGLPQLEGEITLPVNDTVTVTTDENGVPHIKAESIEDLFFAQGFVQAQQRMFQMELSRRQASGTLSEIIGEATVDNDKYFRTLGLRRAAEKSYELYDGEAKDVLHWFSDGVNAYIEQAKENGTLPIEFTLLGIEPDEWTPIDSLTIGKFMAFDLGGHWERQAFNYYLLKEYEEEEALELFPAYPEERMNIIEDSEIDVALSFKDALIPEPFNGSNNWVVSSEKSASGKPLLADDPHLGLATPSIWYEMHLEAEDINVAGVIFAGVPGIILGHNEHIAWGVTNTGPDVQQLYIEKRNPENETQFLFEDEWEDAEVIQEPIHVKDGQTIDYEVIETRHGPVISEFAHEADDDTVFSLRWTALDPTTELKAILNINRATNWEEFEKGLEDFLAPTQNFVFASTDGTIAYKANGRIPIYEDSSDALLPLPGWEEKYEWKGFIPFDELPKVINPEKGFIATANNRVVSDEYPYHISNVWAQPYRYERIFEVLEEKDKLTLDDMKQLQMDAMNLRAREFVPYFAELLEGIELSEAATSALARLNDWNFVDDQHLVQPLIFDYWFQAIERKLFAEINEEVEHLFTGKPQVTDMLLRKGNESLWIQKHGSIEELLATTLEETVETLTTTYGSEQENWRWGDYHQVQFKHPLSSASKLLAFLFNKVEPLPVDGSAVTPLAARANEDGLVNHGASWRFVIDLDDITTGHHTVSPGQSGHVKSEWYSDQTTDWVDGTFHETSLTHYDGKVLTIQPEN